MLHNSDNLQSCGLNRRTVFTTVYLSFSRFLSWKLTKSKTDTGFEKEVFKNLMKNESIML